MVDIFIRVKMFFQSFNENQILFILLQEITFMCVGFTSLFASSSIITIVFPERHFVFEKSIVCALKVPLGTKYW